MEEVSAMLVNLRLRKYWWFWLAILSAILGACDSFTQIDPTPVNKPGNSGLIAYIGTDGNLYTIDRNGENKRLLIDKASLTSEGGQDDPVIQQPTWSPNGESVAVVSVIGSNGSESNSSLYTVSRDGSQLTEIFNSNEHTPFYLYWSPDSHQLSFLSSSRNADGLILQLVPHDGGEVRLIGIGQPYYWAWSPDSQSILTHTGGSAQLNPEALISLQNLKGDSEGNELALKPSVFQAPAWSPDGQAWLLAVEEDNGNKSLLLTNTMGETLDVLAPVGRSISFGWSPDGSKVAYLTETPLDQDDPTATLTIVILDENDDDKVIIEQNPVVAFFWSPDSQKIAYIVPKLRVPQGEITQLDLPEPELVFQLYTLNLVSRESSILFEFDPTQEFLSVMQFFDQYQRSATIWSPDSLYLVISGEDQDENQGIYVISVSKEESSRFIAPGILAFWSWN